MKRKIKMKKKKNKKINRAKKLKRKVSKKPAKNKKRKSVVLKIKKIVKKISTKQKKVKVKVKKHRKTKSKNLVLLSLGKIHPSHGKILTVIMSIVFIITGMVFVNVVRMSNDQAGQVAGASTQVNSPTKLERGIKQMVDGYPIEKMVPYISKRNPQTAAFLVAIAKKESNWGKRRPVLNGEDCYNYWGFRLQTERMGSDGHTCFNSPREAVNAVGDRLDELIQEEKINSPNEMVVWKCGYGCQDEEKDKSDLKWIKDVGYYYNELGRYL